MRQPSVNEKGINMEDREEQKLQEEEAKDPRADFQRERKKGIAIGAAAGLALAAVLWLATGGFTYLMNLTTSTTLNGQVEAKLRELEGLMRRNYLKADEIDQEELREGLYQGLVSGLGDQYSKYYSAEEYRDVKRSNEGNYAGVGITISQDQETGEVVITECSQGRPAEAAGLQAGDVLVQIDELVVSQVEFSAVSDYIHQQEEGAVLHFVVDRDGERVETDVTVNLLETIVVNTQMMEDSVGYIQITEFTDGTPHQFQEAMDSLAEQGMQRLIIDLRGNPGGLLSSVCDTLDSFMPEGLLVSVKKSSGEVTEYTSSGETPISIPLVVLVNEGSASASEIFAGAVQDHGVGTLVGKTTYGKGVVQSYYALDDGSVLRLTASSYLTPKGTDLNGTGITPDVEVESMTVNDLIAGEKWEDRQLLKAVEVVNSLK